MKHIITFVACLATGCTYETLQSEDANDMSTPLQASRGYDERSHVSVHDKSTQLSDQTRYSLKPPCKPDKFLADAIPAGYILDPNCPPELIWPPRLTIIPDPGPMRTMGLSNER